MNRKLFKTITFGIPVVLGCVTACSAISSIESKNSGGDVPPTPDIPDPRPTNYNPLPYEGEQSLLKVNPENGQCLGFIDGFDKNDPKYNSYDTLYIPNTIKSFAERAFQSNIPASVKNIIFEDDSEITEIANCAFFDISHSLKYLEIPEKVASVTYYTFWMDDGDATIYFKNPVDCTLGMAWAGWGFFKNSKIYFKNFVNLPTWTWTDTIKYMYGSAHVYTMGLDSKQIEKFKQWFKNTFPIRDGDKFENIQWN